MRINCLIVAVAFVSMPAFAEDVQYNGYTLEVDAGQEARVVERMASGLYETRSSSAQIVDKAQACLAGREDATVESAEPANGQLVAHVRANYRVMFSTRSVGSRLVVEATDGRFRIVQSELGLSQADGSRVAIAQGEGGWDKALDAAIEAERRLVDCLYR